jgi:hypothetical protein
MWVRVPVRNSFGDAYYTGGWRWTSPNEITALRDRVSTPQAALFLGDSCRASAIRVVQTSFSLVFQAFGLS